MDKQIGKIGFGGGCHWCTEAVFMSLSGVFKVEQGFVASTQENSTFSEAIIAHFDLNSISLKDLIEIHLNTHKSTSAHTMREKYRSAVYVFTQHQFDKAGLILEELQSKFQKRIITKILDFHKFRPSDEHYVDYYYRNPKKPFCTAYIDPKLRLLHEQFADHTNIEKRTFDCP